MSLDDSGWGSQPARPMTNPIPSNPHDTSKEEASHEGNPFANALEVVAPDSHQPIERSSAEKILHDFMPNQHENQQNIAWNVSSELGDMQSSGFSTSTQSSPSSPNPNPTSISQASSTPAQGSWFESSKNVVSGSWFANDSASSQGAFGGADQSTLGSGQLASYAPFGQQSSAHAQPSPVQTGYPSFNAPGHSTSIQNSSHHQNSSAFQQQTPNTAKIKKSKAPWIAVVLALLLGGGAGAGAGWIAATEKSEERDQNNTAVLQQSGSQASSTIRDVLQKVEPGVVAINTFNDRGQVAGAGTGMILTKDGEVLTNGHVINNAVKYQVLIAGQKDPVEADLIGAQLESDVALIKIRNQSNLTPVTIGDSDKTQVGDPVVAIGNALALGPTPSVTTGIISAKDRQIGDSTIELGNLLQTDAAINPGNSGGPLSNADGEVIGMNTAVIQRAGDEAFAQNIGFAIPSKVFQPIIKDIRNGGGSLRPRAYLGVRPADNSPAIALNYNFTTDTGAVVQSVETNSPADKAGLKRFDVITKIGKDDIQDAASLISKVRELPVGESVTVTYERDRQTSTVTVTLGSRPS